MSSGGFTVRRSVPGHVRVGRVAADPASRPGRRLWPIASSFGRMRVRITAMRGWKPFMSKTLKSDGVERG